MKKFSYLSSALAVAIIQLSSAALLFFGIILLARLLGPTDFGAYDFADTWIELLLFIGLMGFDRLLILKVAIYLEKRDWGLLRGIVRFSRNWSLTLSLLIVPCFMLFIFLRFHGFGLWTSENPEEANLILAVFSWAIFLMPLRILLKLNQVNLQGASAATLGYLPEFVLRPLFTLIFMVVFSRFQTLDAVNAMLLHCFAALISMLVSQYFWQRQLPTEAKQVAPVVQSSEWLREALPFMFISAFSLLNVRGGAAVLGLVVDLDTLAMYGVSIRLTGLSSLAISATSAVLAGRIAVLYEQGKMQELQALITHSTRLLLLVSLPLILLLMFWGNYILGLFGAEYYVAHKALIILLVGQIFNAATGVNGWLIMMTRNEKIMAYVFAFASILHVLGLLILSPIFGLEGAAFATALSNVVMYVTLTIYAYLKMGINSSPF